MSGRFLFPLFLFIFAIIFNGCTTPMKHEQSADAALSTLWKGEITNETVLLTIQSLEPLHMQVNVIPIAADWHAVSYPLHTTPTYHANLESGQEVRLRNGDKQLSMPIEQLGSINPVSWQETLNGNKSYLLLSARNAIMNVTISGLAVIEKLPGALAYLRHSWDNRWMNTRELHTPIASTFRGLSHVPLMNESIILHGAAFGQNVLLSLGDCKTSHSGPFGVAFKVVSHKAVSMEVDVTSFTGSGLFFTWVFSLPIHIEQECFFHQPKE